MEKKLLCGISQRHFQGKISSQKVLFIRGKLINSFYEKFFAVFPRHRRENDFQSEIIKNCIIFCTDIVSKGLVKAPQGSFRSIQGKSKLIQRYRLSNCNGQSVCMLLGKITKRCGKSRKIGIVCNSKIISGIAEGVQGDPGGFEKNLDLMFRKNRSDARV